MQMDSDTGIVSLVEEDLVDMDQLWNLEHLFGSVSSTLRVVQMGVHFTFEFNLGDRRTRLENRVTSSSKDSQSI